MGAASKSRAEEFDVPSSTPWMEPEVVMPKWLDQLEALDADAMLVLMDILSQAEREGQIFRARIF